MLTDGALWGRMSTESRAIAAQHDESASLRRFEEIYAEVTGYLVPAQLPREGHLHGAIAA